MNQTVGIALLMGIVGGMLLVNHVTHRVTQPIPGSKPYRKRTCLVKEDDGVIRLYSLKRKFTWWQMVTLPIDDGSRAYWRREIADAEACEAYARAETRELMLAQTGIMSV